MFKLDKSISKQIINATGSVHVAKINIKGTNYYVKPDNEMKEMIGYYLARMFHLSCAKSASIKVGSKHYFVSLDLNEQHKFVLAHNFSLNGMTLQEIIKKLQTLPFYNDTLQKDMILMYIYDILFMNDDRHDRNWGFLMQNSSKFVLIDNGNIFSIKRKPYIRFMPDLYWEKDIENAIAEDFGCFFDSLGDENRKVVEQCLDASTISLANLNNIFSMIEEKYQCKINPEFLNMFSERYQKIMNILEEKRCNYGR